MKIQAPDRSIPDRATHDNLTVDGLVALRTGKYSDAEKIFLEQLNRLITAQKEVNRPIHKGESLYHLGLAQFYREKLPDAIRNILLAYIEDTLNLEHDKEDDADRASAAGLLRDVFNFKLRILREIKIRAAEIKTSEKWNDARDPNSILQEVAERLKFNPKELLTQCNPIPELRKPLLGFPQPREKRVFIGTNYLTNPSIIPIAEEAVIRKGYFPIVPVEQGEPDDVHEDSLALLHTCKYAIIDISHLGGQFMEIERTIDYNIETLLVHEALDLSNPPKVSQMIPKRFNIEFYTDARDLLDIIPKFLP